MKTAISYIRFSTTEQEKGASLRRQEEKTRQWCERNGYTLDTSLKLQDKGVSGYRGKNSKTGKLKAFLDMLEAGKIKADALIIESLDRLTRDEVGDALRLFLNILDFKIKIVTLTPETIFDKKSINDPTNLIIAIIELCRGHSESDMKSDRVGDAWRNKKKRARTGHKVSSACPGWLKLENQEFSFVPEKVRSVRKLLELASCGFGVGVIAKKLNEGGFPTMKSTAKHWHTSSVHKILNSRSLFGEYQPMFSSRHTSLKDRKPDGQPIPDYYPALITEEEFYRIQASLSSRRNINSFGKGRQSLKVSNLFGKLIKCAKTGSTMGRIDKGKKSIPSLISTSARAGLTKKETFPYEPFEYHFLAWMLEISPDDLSSSGQISKAKKRLLSIRGQLTQIESKLKKFKTRLLEEEDNDTLLDVVSELTKKRKDLKSEEESLKGETSRHDPASESIDVISTLKNAKGETEIIELRHKLKFLLNELIEAIYVRFEKDSELRQHICFTQIHFKNGSVRKMNIVVQRIYEGGGTSPPIKKTASFSFSTPQVVLKADLRNMKDMSGWMQSETFQKLARSRKAAFSKG